MTDVNFKKVDYFDQVMQEISFTAISVHELLMVTAQAVFTSMNDVRSLEDRDAVQWLDWMK